MSTYLSLVARKLSQKTAYLACNETKYRNPEQSTRSWKQMTFAKRIVFQANSTSTFTIGFDVYHKF